MTTQPRLAVLGATGFIGSRVLAYGQSVGADIRGVTMPRVQEIPAGTDSTEDAAARWQRDHGAAFADLCRSLASCDVVINAAGDPRAATAPRGPLVAANAVLPAIAAAAASRAGVRRLVHISTGAVQGRHDPLDETDRHFPLSPYGVTKAEGERALLAADPDAGQICPELVVYRPTSVQATTHHATRTFARTVPRLPFVPVKGKGEQPVPVVLLDNVVAGILFAATMAEAPTIVLQPDEGMTVRRLLELFGARRVVAVPPRMATAALEQVGRMMSRSPYLTSRLRWFELLLQGQASGAKALAGAGFIVPVGPEGWITLASAGVGPRRDRDL